MNEKQIQLLRDLVAHVEALPAKYVDLSQVSCGTIACALGHAPNVPSWQAAGCVPGRNGRLPWDFVVQHLGLVRARTQDNLFGFPGDSIYDPIDEGRHYADMDHRDLFALRVDRFIAALNG